MNAQQASRAFNMLHTSLVARNAERYSKDNDIAIKHLAQSEVAVKKAFLSFSFEMVDKWVKMQNPTGKGDAFIAVKANIKIVDTLYAIGAGLVSHIDDYSATLIANAFANKGDSITSKTALVSLSKGIEYHALDNVQVLRARMNKAESTASTQRSSTREMLRVLGLADVIKGKTEDNITLTEKGREILSPLFCIAE